MKNFKTDTEFDTLSEIYRPSLKEKAKEADKFKNSMNQTTPTSLLSGRLLAHNTFLNFPGQVLPLLVGMITIPFIIRGLGTERFGLLSLAWVVLGYFTIFDLGLGWATTKFVAEALGKGKEDQLPRLVWMAVTVQ